MNTILNLTPHPVTILNRDGSVHLNILPEETPARVSVKHSLWPYTPQGVRILLEEYEDITDLPPQQPGIWLIVSRTVAERSLREDLLVVTNLARDEQGRVIGCYDLAVLDWN
jgi:hypothetical protein